MKNLNLTTIVVVIVFIVTIFTSQGSSSNPKEMVIDKAKAEGYVAFIVNEKVLDLDEETETKCDGSGWITHGDGHKTQCPGCSSCQKQDVKNQDQQEEVLESKKKVMQQPCQPQYFRRRGILQRIFR